MTGGSNWLLLRAADSEIYGIYSASKAAPRKRAELLAADFLYENAPCYRESRCFDLPRRPGSAYRDRKLF
jgi:hypothetical protein